MYFRQFWGIISSILFVIILSGCQKLDLAQLRNNVSTAFHADKVTGLIGNSEHSIKSISQKKSLNEILDGSLAHVNEGKDFVTTISLALKKDPIVISRRKALESKLAAIEVSQAGKDYQVTSTLYGGVEDITDNTKGIALSLSASRLVFDGGLLDAKISSSRFEAEAERYNLRASVDERAYSLGEIWLELEKHESLKKQIDERLAVLDPLIGQLEQVAKAGIGDVSKVAAAQRTVAGIRVTQTNVYEEYAKAKLDFVNAFGSVGENVMYDPKFIEDMLPEQITFELAQSSPRLLSKYAAYEVALANLESTKAKEEFNIGFEARALRPFAGSGYDSDESIGLVAKKNLYNGGMLQAEIDEAEALAKSAMADVEAAYRLGERTVKAAEQSIESMEKAIRLAIDNAQVASEEILYLRQQLIIGGSTLDSVLLAEARLYEAESQEVKFLAEKRKAELRIATALGLLSNALNNPLALGQVIK